MTTQVVIPTDGVIRGFSGRFSGTVQANVDGSVTIDVRDLMAAIDGGFLPGAYQVRSVVLANADAAVATNIVNNVTTTNVALTIALQPDIPRQLQVVSAPGSPGITAGSLAMVYTGNDGTQTTDTFSLIGAATATFKTTKGVLHLASATVTGLVGGTSPTIEIGINATLCVPIQPGATNVTLLREGVNDAYATTQGTLTNAGLFTPNSAPNATNDYQADYSFLTPI